MFLNRNLFLSLLFFFYFKKNFLFIYLSYFIFKKFLLLQWEWGKHQPRNITVAFLKDPSPPPLPSLFAMGTLILTMPTTSSLMFVFQISELKGRFPGYPCFGKF